MKSKISRFIFMTSLFMKKRIAGVIDKKFGVINVYPSEETMTMDYF
ncbi:hypothetical protein OYT88_17405 [Sporolactobacillus sp. CQH2019]|nr:hypothetical protein [Sporolactobacillus sp. CQH2019]MDD9150317.1 hypothetical protein [Sporolactobacillus sp. CQH2019]